jgi:uncharacterized protein YecE (DUF72 family)
MTGGLFIGTSGWHYDSWLGPFYPERHPKPKLLAFYTGVFAAAEINLSFYRLPSETTLVAWREGTPEGFVFAWKAHRVITHYRQLRNVEDNIAFVFGRMAILGPKTGPVLFQLPPRLKADRDRLMAFIGLLPRGGRYVFEFRHPSWYEPTILDLLRECNAALCISDHTHAPAPCEITADFAYIRGHGPSGRYHGSYDDAALTRWAEQVAGWRRRNIDVFCFFDNDIKAAAPADAKRLAALTGSGQASSPPA